jgi:hypothetical protein
MAAHAAGQRLDLRRPGVDVHRIGSAPVFAPRLGHFAGKLPSRSSFPRWSVLQVSGVAVDDRSSTTRRLVTTRRLIRCRGGEAVEDLIAVLQAVYVLDEQVDDAGVLLR